MKEKSLIPPHSLADEEGAVIYDVAIAGGGLAGLALSIQLAKQGHRVILFEKEQYPFHKVCGEYISLESWDFLTRLGIDLDKMRLPLITRLQISSTKGKSVNLDLPLGGFGISRYLLDDQMCQKARAAGALVEENTKVNNVKFDDQIFSIETTQHTYYAKVFCGTYGKRSNLDIKWKRNFTIASKNKLNNYIGVKYHIKAQFTPDTIALHNFDNGYCGIVKIDGDKYCLCYLTTAANLQKSNGSVQEMEQTILVKNPHLKKIFEESEFLFPSPLTISQISFDKKSQINNHVLMIGDAAGMITPICGNGMSMALHGSLLAAEQIDLFLKGVASRSKMENQYGLLWQKQFSQRLLAGRRIQRLSGNTWMTDAFIHFTSLIPNLLKYLINQTHGKPF
ncbi:MAG: NAD(P)/FAD-dependent oxidoreductase [Chitinophagaceae bacterium]